MPDVVTPEVRSRMMSGIRGADTKPEVSLRTALHQCGFRYRKNSRKLPGRPDMTFARYKAVVLVHGCFWHGHGCHLFKWPRTRAAFWRDKINGNRDRDDMVVEELHNLGWRILTVWECSLKGKTRVGLEEVCKRAARWLRAGQGDLEIAGRTEAVL